MLRNILIAITIINFSFVVSITKDFYYEEPLYWDGEPPAKYIYPKPPLETQDLNSFYHIKYNKPSPNLNNVEAEYDNEVFVRPTRQDKNDNFVRFGRGNSDFVRFGRNPYSSQNFLRFGRSIPTKRSKREALNTYDEDKRSERDNFLRFGRTSDDSFVRYGRNRLNNENSNEAEQTKERQSDNLSYEKSLKKPIKLYDKLVKMVPLLSILQKLKELSQNNKDCCN